MNPSLQGLRLWVTRPRNQSAALIASLKNAGADVVALPLLEIAPPLDAAPLEQALAQLDTFDLAVFVSPSAFDAVLERLPDGWPTQLPAAVMGPGSALRAKARGIAQIIAPTGQFDSAGLLQEPALQQLAGKRVVLFRGDGGRDELPQTLVQRGADLTMIAAYRRLPPGFDEAHLRAELAAGCDGMVVSSSEAVQYLFRLAGEVTRQQLQSVLYFAPHPRIVAALSTEGAVRIELTSVGDAGITETILNHFKSDYRSGAHREENA